MIINHIIHRMINTYYPVYIIYLKIDIILYTHYLFISITGGIVYYI